MQILKEHIAELYFTKHLKSFLLQNHSLKKKYDGSLDVGGKPENVKK